MLWCFFCVLDYLKQNQFLQNPRTPHLQVGKRIPHFYKERLNKEFVFQNIQIILMIL